MKNAITNSNNSVNRNDYLAKLGFNEKTWSPSFSILFISLLSSNEWTAAFNSGVSNLR